jgi:hypothetical protein
VHCSAAFAADVPLLAASAWCINEHSHITAAGGHDPVLLPAGHKQMSSWTSSSNSNSNMEQ